MKRGAIASPIPIGQPIPLTADDLSRLRSPRFVASAPAKLRDSHHRIARLRASGLRMNEIAAQTGYSYCRVKELLASPAMDELVACYREKVNEAFVESQDAFHSLATANMLAAERHIADHIAELDETGELLPVRTALAISRDAADRFGYGKKTQQTNINVDFAAALEKAIARSGKQIDMASSQSIVDSSRTTRAVTIVHERVEQPCAVDEPTRAPSTEPLHSPAPRSSSPTWPSVVQSPLIRRRA